MIKDIYYESETFTEKQKLQSGDFFAYKQGGNLKRFFQQKRKPHLQLKGQLTQ